MDKLLVWKFVDPSVSKDSEYIFFHYFSTCSILFNLTQSDSILLNLIQS